MTNRPHRPAFEIIFIHDDIRRTLSIWHQGRKERVQDLQVAFALAVLGRVIPARSPRDLRVYDLGMFLDPDFTFRPSPQLGIKQAVIREMDVRVRGPSGYKVDIKLDALSPLMCSTASGGIATSLRPSPVAGHTGASPGRVRAELRGAQLEPALSISGCRTRAPSRRTPPASSYGACWKIMASSRASPPTRKQMSALCSKIPAIVVERIEASHPARAHFLMTELEDWPEGDLCASWRDVASSRSPIMPRQLCAPVATGSATKDFRTEDCRRAGCARTLFATRSRPTA